ncbi:hypothetical protein ACO0LC_12215 [Undibacterium sp. JH2W]|uniref:hypothetical protein n=1 Tax=Undibacterium sp. JH2W TaxID=3413037 RepID=UPI003BF38BB3
MRTSTLSAAFLFATCCLHAQASEILEIQDYHASEAQVDKNGPWLGLQQMGRGWRLVATKPRFKNVPDPISGAGVRVSTSLSNVRILLSDPGLKAGRVSLSDEMKLVSGSVDEEFELTTLPSLGQERIMHLQGSEYSLQNREGKIYFRHEGREQYLFDHVENQDGDNNGRLIWIGDLDHDGKLDFIVDASNEYNVTELHLYLSGQAAKGELLKLVSKRKSTGC